MRKLVILFAILVAVVLSGARPLLGLFLGTAVWMSFLLFRLRKTPTTVLAASFGQSRPSGAAQAGEVLLGLVLLLAATAGQGMMESKQAAHQTVLDQDRKIRETLVVQLPSALASGRQALGRANTLFETDRFDEAQTVLIESTAQVAAYRVLSRPEVAALEAEGSAVAAKVAAMLATRKSFEDGKTKLAAGEQARAEQRFMDAEEAFSAVVAELNAIDPGRAAKLKLEPGPILADAGRKLASVRKAARRERGAREEARVKAEAEALVCGKKPKNSAWDGAIIGLERFIKESAHDPDSIDVDGCSEASMTEDNCWVFRCKVRGKNAFGAKVLQVKTFKKNARGFRELK